MSEPSPYPPIADYALISDCRSAALVSSSGSIDWGCVPRLDEGSCFGRLLDWEQGGFCSLDPADSETTLFRRYVDGTLVLETTFRSSGGEARLFDCFTIDESHERAGPPAGEDPRDRWPKGTHGSSPAGGPAL